MAIATRSYWRNDEKWKAIERLRNCVEINSPFQALWLAVVEKAILDIGHRRKKGPGRGRRTDPNQPTTFVRSTVNSDHLFKGECPSWVEDAGLSFDFLIKVLNESGVLPVPADRYDGEQ